MVKGNDVAEGTRRDTRMVAAELAGWDEAR